MDDARVLVDMVVGAPADDVWRALREPEAVARWFGWEYDGLDAEIRQIFVDAAQAEDVVRTLSWADGDRIEVTDDAGSGGARLRVLRPPHGADFDGVLDPVDEGWITFTQQLRFALERHPGEPRRTVSALDVDLGPADDPLLSRLGLRPLGDDPVGGRYELALPGGDRVAGELFFQSDLQLGLSVEQERDALLVVARTPPSVAPPTGRAMFVLNLFGQDDDAVARAEERWTRWWGQGAGADPDVDEGDGPPADAKQTPAG